MLGCPITRQVKGYVFEVNLPNESPVTGVVLADQVRCVDWRSRQVVFITSLPAVTIAEVQEKAIKLIASEVVR